jgi:hypothetical protein
MKKINEEYIRNIIRGLISEHINSIVLCEAKNDSDITKGNKKKIIDYLQNKIENNDEEFLELLKSLGYNLNYNKRDLKNFKNSLYDGYDIAQHVMDDVNEVANILSQYTNKNGQVFVRRDETQLGQSPNIRYMEDDFPLDELYKIMSMKDFIDRLGLTYLYDKTANMSSQKYGMSGKNDDPSNLDFNHFADGELASYIGDKNLSDTEGRITRAMSILSKYTDAKYGMDIEIPDVSFTKGNGKLPKDTLIINFDSAIGCPAWNECLVKHACYARSGEKRNPTQFQGNKNKTLMWRATKNDPQLMKMLLDLVKTYCFDYDKAANEILSQGLLSKISVKKLIDKLNTTPLSDSTFFNSEILNILKNNKLVNKVRLNENGDFIGQWIVDAWDNYAGELKLCDINVSAYTCRHLNYDGIKNIILNTSFATDNKNVARHFIAISDSDYDALDETYSGPNGHLVLTKNQVIPKYLPLYNSIKGEKGGIANIGEDSGKVYYKCPCGRKIGGTEISCYQCQVCYQPKEGDATTIIFVKAHGSAQKMIGKYNGFLGVSQNFVNNLSRIEELKREENRRKRQAKKNSKGKTNESIEEGLLLDEVDNNVGYNNTHLSNGAQMRSAKTLGFKAVANNAITSVYNKLNNLDNNNI